MFHVKHPRTDALRSVTHAWCASGYFLTRAASVGSPERQRWRHGGPARAGERTPTVADGRCRVAIIAGQARRQSDQNLTGAPCWRLDVSRETPRDAHHHRRWVRRYLSREAPRNTGAQAPQPDTPLHSQGEPPPARTRMGEGYAPHPQQRPRADMELDTQADAPSWVVRGITRFSPDGYAHLLSTKFTDRMSSRVPASRFSTCVHYRMSIPTDGPRPPREDGPSGRRLATTGTSCTLRSLPSRCGRSLRPRPDRGTAQSAVVTMCPRPPRCRRPHPRPEPSDWRPTRLRHPNFDVDPSPG